MLFFRKTKNQEVWDGLLSVKLTIIFFYNKEIAGNLNISFKIVEAPMTIAIKKLSAYLSSYWSLVVLFLIELFLD
jgi:hypothetical protein